MAAEQLGCSTTQELDLGLSDEVLYGAIGSDQVHGLEEAQVMGMIFDERDQVRIQALGSQPVRVL